MIYIGLYGSQNYGLDTEASDIDAIAVVALSLDQTIQRDSYSLQIPEASGTTTVKDIATFAAMLHKGAPNFVEASHSKYWTGSCQFRKIIEKATYSLNSIKGMFHSYVNRAKTGSNPNKHYLRAIRCFFQFYAPTDTTYSFEGTDPQKIAMKLLLRTNGDLGPALEQLSLIINRVSSKDAAYSSSLDEALFQFQKNLLLREIQ